MKIKEHKGTFVSCSTIEEAKEVFEMRRILEGEAVRRACRLFDEEQLQELETLVEEERHIYGSRDFSESLKLSGDFHLKIAEIAGNSYFYQYLEDLISLTYVIIAIYGRGEWKHVVIMIIFKFLMLLSKGMVTLQNTYLSFILVKLSRIFILMRNYKSRLPCQIYFFNVN
ncbi:GntR family transcriptional regulator [Peribacillus frigoritolerans]|nr:GntR family transcriptional regulator [Peribacillus frigoritolerans]